MKNLMLSLSKHEPRAAPSIFILRQAQDEATTLFQAKKFRP